MALRESKMIHVDPDSELGRHLAGAADQPIVLESNGKRYRLMREGHDDVWVNYDPEAVRRTVARFAGSITPEEGERLKAELYRAREEGSRPPDRP